jgi:hypothetical protein
MTNKKMPKNAEKFSCKICNFECFKQSNYDKHILTAKHKRLTNTNKKMPKNATTYSCICGKTYKHQSSLIKHKKTCPHMNNSIVIQENLNEKPSVMDIISQNKEIIDALVLQNEQLMKKNDELTNTIKEIVPKIGNNNNNTNNFNLQVFLNEDCKDALNFSEFIDNIKVSFEDLENQAQLGYVKGISKLFLENLHDLGTHKRPIHCTDKKRKTLYIKENDKWDKGSQQSIKNGIQELTRKSHEQLSDIKDVRNDEYEDADSDFSNKCIDIQQSLIPNAPRDKTISKVLQNIIHDVNLSQQDTIES